MGGRVGGTTELTPRDVAGNAEEDFDTLMVKATTYSLGARDSLSDRPYK